jgi:hypothetical protein
VISRVAKGWKKKEKMEAIRLRGTMRKPTQGMAKRLVRSPMREIRLKWSATKGAVPSIATPVETIEFRIFPNLLLPRGLGMNRNFFLPPFPENTRHQIEDRKDSEKRELKGDIEKRGG